MMNRRSLLFFGLVMTVLCLCPSADADTWTLTLIPASGSIAGPAGSTIGWGYTITNQSTTNWLVLTGLSADPFLNGTPDASYFTFPILAPNTIATGTFNAGTFTGLFGLTWDATAPAGFTNTGTFVLSGEFWDSDPFVGGQFVALAQDQSADYSATVSPVPEPTSLILMATGLMGFVRRRSKSL